MAFTSITKPTLGKAGLKTLIDAVIDDLNDLNLRVNSLTGDRTVISNGSFESDTDADSTPDGWVKTLYTGGSYAYTGDGLADTNCIHGARAVKFTSPGGASNGGGQLESTSRFEVSPQRPLLFSWQWFSTATTTANAVDIKWFTAANSLISQVNVATMSAGNPSTWRQEFATVTPPSTARYGKLIIIGCATSSTTAGSTYFDNVVVTPIDFNRKFEYEGSGTTAKTYTFIPLTTQAYRISAFGGGGAGGGVSTSQTFGGGGGGGGEFAQSVLILTAGTSYAISVGGGGLAAAGFGNGPAGGDTTFASTTVVAKGGSGGSSGTSGSHGAGGTGGTGLFKLSGIDGTDGLNASNGGQGGGSISGKAGGSGGTSGVGSAPNSGSRGAGGGGAFRTNNQVAGDGGAGSLFIEY